MLQNTHSSFKIVGRVRAIVRDASTGQIKRRTRWAKNLIPTVGLTAILRRLANEGTKTNEGMVTYGAVGDGASVPALSDIKMGNETKRVVVSVTTVSITTLTIETYFNTSEANGTITQFALFGEDATAVKDSGTMFEYVNFAASFTKAATETLTVETQIRIE